MSQLDLLSVAPCPSPRLRRRAELSGALTHAKKHFSVLTHHNRYCMDAAWLAVLADDGETRSIEQIMADECRLLEEAGRTGYGMTELDAVIDLIRRNHPDAPELSDLIELRELESRR